MDTLTARDYKDPPIVVFTKGTRPHNKDEAPTYHEGGVANTLNTFDNSETRVNEYVCEPKAYRICGKYSNSMMSDNPNSGCYQADTGITLDTSSQSPDKNQGGIMVLEKQEAIGFYAQMKAESMCPAVEKAGCIVNGTNLGFQNGVAYGIDRAAFNQGQNAQYKPQIDEEKCQTVVAKGPNAVGQPYAVGNGQMHQTEVSDKTGALNCMHDQQAAMCDYIVRRLTPKECARLQGFPTDWADDIAVTDPTEEDMLFWRGVFDTYSEITGTKKKSDNQISKWIQDPHTDSAEYKMWGNGVALPCVYFVMSGIAEELEND